MTMTIARTITKPGEPNICAIVLQFVADKYNMTRGALVAQSREAWMVEPRQIAHYLCALFMPHKEVQIAAAFKRERTTVTHSVKTVMNRMETEPHYKQVVESLHAELREVLKAQNQG